MTVAELAARDHREGAWVLFIEGLPFAFTDRSEIAGSGALSWIGTDYGARRIREGLTVPETIAFSTSMEHGMLSSEDGATFEIRDFDREIIALIAEQEGTQIGETLGPKQDPAPADVLDHTGLNSVELRNKWVNHEAIGPAGQRRYYGCMPITMPGPDHAAVDQGAEQTLAPSVVREAPTWYEGVRCALYWIYRDTDTGQWPNWRDQHDSGESLMWFGSVTELSAEATVWQLTCDGPSSWLRRQLGANRSTQWRKVGTAIKLSSEPGRREDLAAYRFYYKAVDGTVDSCGSSYYDALDALPLTGTPTAYRQAINTRITTVAATPDPFIWSTLHDATILFDFDKVVVQISKLADKAAAATICLHEKVWRYLGYDPLVQRSFDAENSLAIGFRRALEFPGSFADEPAPGYYVATFSTVPVGYTSVNEAGSDCDNGGQPRYWKAIYTEGMTTIYPEGDQEITLNSTEYLEGQTCRAVFEHDMAGGAGTVDSLAVIALRGSYRESAEAEPTTMAQLAVCNFVDDTSFGGHAPGAAMWIADFIDPRLCGIDRKPLDRAWSSLDLRWCPVNWLGYNLLEGDWAHLILLRTMLSTGTAYWTGYEGQGATLTLGQNAHPDADYAQGSDVEIADLGLAIPAALIDAKSFHATAIQMPGGLDSPLNNVKWAFIGGFDSQDLIWRTLEQRGWGMGFVGRRFRLFNRPQLLNFEDVEVVLGPDDFAVDDPQFVERADLRPLTPRDAFAVTYGKPLVEGTGSDSNFTHRVRSGDPHARTRRSNNEDQIEGGGLIASALWSEGEGPPGFELDWNRVMGQLANWYAAPHVAIEVPVKWSKARLLGPGSVVQFSSLYAPTREGIYGIGNRLGRVTQVTVHLAELNATVRILVQPGDPARARRWAPIAQVVEDVATVEQRHEAARRKFYCYGDAFEHGQPQRDVAWFVEPAWSSLGGEAVVHGWQHDGREWSQTCSFTVESVDTLANTITYKAGSFNGKWWEARPTTLVLAPYDDQPIDSWTREVFIVLTRADGKFGTVPTPGFKMS